MAHHSTCPLLLLLLLLLLTCLPGFSASEREQGGSAVVKPQGPTAALIDGVDVVSVGVPYGFQCRSNCYPDCEYSWTRGNVTTQGPELSVQILHVRPTVTLTCTVVNPATGETFSVHKTLKVTAGPSNVQISGPAFLTTGTASNYTCSADCYPSCSYSWTVVLEREKFSTAKGDVISVTPPGSTVASETLICEAEDTVSHLFISTTLFLWVASVNDISISGESTVTMGKQYTFMCYVSCIPPCTFNWKYMGKTFKGDEVQIPILHQGDEPKFASHLKIIFSDYNKVEPLICEATNPASHATLSATKNLTVIDPYSVRPASQKLPIAGQAFSLECVGAQDPVSVTWLRDKHPLAASDGVHFSPDNLTLTFSPLMQTDDGLYQCVVSEGGTPVQSAGYKMQISYGPSSVMITGVDVVTVGVLYSFQCSASCYPACQYSWTRDNVTSAGPELSLKLRELRPTQTLTCTAFNPATGVSVTTHKTLQMTEGPSNIHISGPAFLTNGAASNFTCSADCYPSCSYTWTVFVDGEPISTVKGDSISVTPPGSPIGAETLSCEAEDTVSHLFVSKNLRLFVASLSDITITGDTTVEMGEHYTYTCSAICVPSCSFTWTFMGKTFQGDQVRIPVLRGVPKPTMTSELQITVSDYSKTEPVTCEATNVLSHATISTSKNITVVDPFSVRPSSQARPIAEEPFTLQCVGAPASASITWLKDKLRLMPTKRVIFSAGNATVTFSPLFQGDGGLYQCLVLESGDHTDSNKTEAGIISIGYLMQVNYGPNEVLIVKPGEGPVGEELITQPGSTTELQCVTDCFPACSISWFYLDELLDTNATIFFRVATPPYEASLTCVAFNSVTKENRTAGLTVLVPDGPTAATISGPDALEIGVAASFKCSAVCTPSCTFTWTLDGQTMTGSAIDITVNRHVSQEAISCQAENTFTGKTAIANETLSVSDPVWCGC